jgi:hypothetical protein
MDGLLWDRFGVNVFRFFRECKTEMAIPFLSANPGKSHLENSVDGSDFSKYKFFSLPKVVMSRVPLKSC